MLPSVLPTEADHVPVLADEVLTALARGDDLPAALELAARAGAAVVTGRGPFAAQIAV